MAFARGLSISVSLALLAPVLVLATVLAITLASLDVPGTSFRSPDEHASYLFTKTLGETGQLFYTRDYLDNDQENLLYGLQVQVQVLVPLSQPFGQYHPVILAQSSNPLNH